jgi:hypothetical protein
MKTLCGWIFPVLWALTILSGLGVWMIVMNDTLIYWAGSSLRDTMLGLFTVCLTVSVYQALQPVMRYYNESSGRLIVALFCTLTLCVMLLLAIDQFLSREVPRFRADRISYSGESDLAIMKAFTDHDFYYPPETFLEQARLAIPLDEAVLVISDIRPDPVNYALYPRPVYALPDLQRAALANAIASWSQDGDPAFPEGFAPWLQQPTSNPEAIARETEAMIRLKDIRWVVVVDAFNESNNRIVHIGGDR